MHVYGNGKAGDCPKTARACFYTSCDPQSMPGARWLRMPHWARARMWACRRVRRVRISLGCAPLLLRLPSTGRLYVPGRDLPAYALATMWASVVAHHTLRSGSSLRIYVCQGVHRSGDRGAITSPRKTYSLLGQRWATHSLPTIQSPQSRPHNPVKPVSPCWRSHRPQTYPAGPWRPHDLPVIRELAAPRRTYRHTAHGGKQSWLDLLSTQTHTTSVAVPSGPLFD